MSNATRHALGVLIGVLAVPVMILGLGWAFVELTTDGGTLGALPDPVGTIVAAGVLIVLSLLIGLMAGSRLSPLAALLAGLALLALGIALLVPTVREAVVAPLGPLSWIGDTVVYLVPGAILLGSALPGSRWRALPRRRHGVAHASEPENDETGYGGTGAHERDSTETTRGEATADSTSEQRNGGDTVAEPLPKREPSRRRERLRGTGANPSPPEERPQS